MPRETKADYSLKELRSYALDFQRSIDTLNRHIDAIEEDKIRTLHDVKCAYSRAKSLELLEKFVFAVREAHLETRSERGDWG